MTDKLNKTKKYKITYPSGYVTVLSYYKYKKLLKVIVYEKKTIVEGREYFEL